MTARPYIQSMAMRMPEAGNRGRLQGDYGVATMQDRKKAMQESC